MRERSGITSVEGIGNGCCTKRKRPRSAMPLRSTAERRHRNGHAGLISWPKRRHPCAETGSACGESVIHGDTTQAKCTLQKKDEQISKRKQTKQRVPSTDVCEHEETMGGNSSSTRVASTPKHCYVFCLQPSNPQNGQTGRCSAVRNSRKLLAASLGFFRSSANRVMERGKGVCRLV